MGHIDKVHLVKGDVCQTIPEFVAQHSHLMVSLLFLDLDLYEPTKVALSSSCPRMPKGAVDRLRRVGQPHVPGETLALLDCLGIGNLRLRRMDWTPTSPSRCWSEAPRPPLETQDRKTDRIMSEIQPGARETRRLAQRNRRHAVEMTHLGKAPHVASVLSIADILAVHYGRVLRVRPQEPSWPERDRFILSKGHAGPGCTPPWPSAASSP